MRINDYVYVDNQEDTNLYKKRRIPNSCLSAWSATNSCFKIPVAISYINIVIVNYNYFISIVIIIIITIITIIIIIVIIIITTFYYYIIIMIMIIIILPSASLSFL